MRPQDTYRTIHTFIFAGSLSLLLFASSLLGVAQAQVIDGVLPVRPTAATLPPRSIEADSARLEGLVFPGDTVTTSAWFEWGVTPELVTLTTQRTTLGALLEMRHMERITGLSSGTTYYYRIAIQNENGVARGDILSFRTPSPSEADPGVPSQIEVIKEVRRCLSECEALTQNATLFPGDEVEFVITVRNRTGATIQNAVIEDTLPSSLEYISASQGGNYNGALRTVSWRVDEFRSNREIVVSFRAAVRQLADPAAEENVAVFSAPPIQETSEPVILNVNISAKPLLVVVEMAPGPRTVSSGDRVFYTVRYKNVTESEIAPVSFRMLLPNSLTFSESATAGVTESGGVVSFHDEAIGPGEEKAIGFFARAGRGVQNEETLITVVAEYEDPETGFPNHTVTFIQGTDEERPREARGMLFWLPTTLLGWVVFAALLTGVIALFQNTGNVRTRVGEMWQKIRSHTRKTRKKGKREKKEPAVGKRRGVPIPGWPFDKSVSFEGDRIRKDVPDASEEKIKEVPLGEKPESKPEKSETRPEDQLDDDIRKWLYESPRKSKLPKNGNFEEEDPEEKTLPK